MTLSFILTVPFNTLFVTLAGCRVVAGVGGVLILISVLLSAFGTQFWHLLISYSIIGGKLNSGLNPYDLQNTKCH